jgi:hypothetical protein
VIIFLADVAEGGETGFPELNLSVKPKRGSLVCCNVVHSTVLHTM